MQMSQNKKVAQSPTDIHSLKREWHIIISYFGTICIIIVTAIADTASTFLGQSDQMRCQNV